MTEPIIDEMEEADFYEFDSFDKTEKINYMQIRLNTNIRGFKSGKNLRIKIDKHGVPLDIYWRRRLNDAETDNCVSIVGYIQRN